MAPYGTTHLNLFVFFRNLHKNFIQTKKNMTDSQFDVTDVHMKELE